MAPANKNLPPPVAVIYGAEDHKKLQLLQQEIDELLPPEVDRALALAEYDGSKSEEHGGPSLAQVMDDLLTLPFLAPRRVVVVRDADKFITAHREKLERYVAAPSSTGSLILVCKSMSRSTKLYKAVARAGGRLVECKKLTIRGLIEFVTAEGRARQKRIDYPVAARIVELTGQDQGLLTNEVEKLCLYAADRVSITSDDIDDLVGLTREEKIFAAMDAAAAGQLPRALELWHQVTVTDKDAVYKALGGMAYKVRGWLTAHQMAADGTPVAVIAPKVGMWNHERDLASLLRRLNPVQTKRLLAHIARLDSQAKSGLRSIETGIEALLTEVATPAT